MFRKVILGFGVVLLLTASALAFPALGWLIVNGPDYYDRKIKMATVRSDIKRIEAVVTAYWQKTGYYPETLIWGRGDPEDNIPVWPADMPLYDPWGNLYIYEPQTINPKTGAPLIYSDCGPKKNKRITNWD